MGRMKKNNTSASTLSAYDDSADVDNESPAFVGESNAVAEPPQDYESEEATTVDVVETSAPALEIKAVDMGFLKSVKAARGTILIYVRGGSRMGEYIPVDAPSLAKAWGMWIKVNGKTMPEFTDAVRETLGIVGMTTMYNGCNLTLTAVMGTRPYIEGVDYFELL